MKVPPEIERELRARWGGHGVAWKDGDAFYVGYTGFRGRRTVAGGSRYSFVDALMDADRHPMRSAPKPNPPRWLCAYCRRWFGEDKVPRGAAQPKSIDTATSGISHGMCAECAALDLDELDELARKQQANPPGKRRAPYPQQVEDAMLARFGTTEDPLEAGYILSDGRMLDFSGKDEGGQPGQRAYDHRQIADASRKGVEIPGGTEGMLWLMSTIGALRISFFGDSINIDAEGVLPTAAQSRAVERAWDDLGRPPNVSIDWGGGRAFGHDVFHASQIREALMSRGADDRPAENPRPWLGVRRRVIRRRR